MTVYNIRTAIHETCDNLPSIHDLIETLDELLNYHGIRHSFSYPDAEEMERAKAEKGKDLCYWLHFESEQKTEIALVIALFTRKHLKKTDAEILTTMQKALGGTSAEVVEGGVA